jgi:dolichyl-phosphate beta-glucosyltransferase
VRHGIGMAEVPVTWREIAGSKIDILADSFQMMRDIIVIRLAYATRMWDDGKVRV